MAVYSEFDITRFFSLIDIRSEEECWFYKRKSNGPSSSYTLESGQKRLAHIIAWEIANNRIADAPVKHLCKNNRCLNPLHLKIYNVIDSFWDRVDKTSENGCWVWTGERSGNNYGTITINKKRQSIYRFSWELHYGEIDEYTLFKTSCGIRLCLNPSHLVAETSLDRFWKNINKTDSCWDWIGAKNSRNYGVMHYKNKRVLAHRLSYRLFKGEIPDGLIILHKCNRSVCVNPEHLKAGTFKENVQDAFNAGTFHPELYILKTHKKRREQQFCKYAHEFTEENTRIVKTTRGGTARQCKECAKKRLKNGRTHCPEGHEYNKENTGYENNGKKRYCKVCRSRTHCKNGHELVGENIIDKGGCRMCRICMNAQRREYQKRKREEKKNAKIGNCG